MTQTAAGKTHTSFKIKIGVDLNWEHSDLAAARSSEPDPLTALSDSTHSQTDTHTRTHTKYYAELSNAEHDTKSNNHHRLVVEQRTAQAQATARVKGRSPCSFFSVSQNRCSSVKYLSRMNTLERPSVAMAGGALASQSAAAPLSTQDGDHSRSHTPAYCRRPAAAPPAPPAPATPRRADTYFWARNFNKFPAFTKVIRSIAERVECFRLLKGTRALEDVDRVQRGAHECKYERCSRLDENGL